MSSQTPETIRTSFIAGLIHMFPMLIGMVPFGLLIGAMGKQAGLETWEIMLMNGAVFAGASQFIALDMWQSPLPGFTIIATTLMVNLRHVLMGAAAAPYVKKMPTAPRTVFLFAMADENWAMYMRRAISHKSLSVAYVMGLTVPFYLNWQLWSYLGTQLGGLIENPESLGFDYVFTVVFLLLVFGFWKTDRRLSPIITSACTALIVQYLLPGTWYIFIGALAGIAAAALSYKKDENHER